MIEALRNTALLSGIDDVHLERIASVVTTETLETGEALVTEGSVGEDLYFLRRGTFVVTVSDGDVQTEIGRLAPGDVIGETQLIAGGRRTATVRALEHCEVLRLPHDEFDALMMESDGLREAVSKIIRQRLREAALRVALRQAVGSDGELLDLLCERATWLRLKRGEKIWEQGAEADDWCVLVSGELTSMVTEHGVRREIETLHRGEMFGEVALIRSEPRSSTVIAARDSWVARFDEALLGREIMTNSEALMTLVQSLAGRLSEKAGHKKRSAPVVVLFPRDPGLDASSFAEGLACSMGGVGHTLTAETLHREGIVGDARHLPIEHPAWLRFEAWLESRRHDADYVVLVTDGMDDAWTRVAQQYADTFLLYASADSDPAPGEIERQVLVSQEAADPVPAWLVLEHPADRALPSGTAAWLNARSLKHHAHVRKGNAGDIGRLARWLLGRTAGLALSGGGARGFVHFGTVSAMQESGIEIDLIAGTSAGAQAGALLACGESPESAFQKASDEIEKQGNPLGELDIPLMALLRNRRLRDGLQDLFGETRIEDTWIPFRIVATNLTESRREVFDRGPLWQRVFAASSPPGLMAPVKDGEHLLCDGGLVDNLPVSVLVDEQCAVKLAAFIGSTPALPAPQSSFPTSWTLLFAKLFRTGRFGDVPTLKTTLLQCASVPAAAQLDKARATADILFQPDLSAFSLTDVSAGPEMFRAGRDNARQVLEQHHADRGNDSE